MIVTVAIPVRDGGPLFAEVLDAVRAQRLDDEVELLVCDTSSSDGSADAARARGATVLTIAPGEFGHGRTRNLLMERAAGEHVAFLTQDAKPATETWLASLLGAFERDADVALAWGPYVPRADASQPVARELTAWFASFAGDEVVRGADITPRRAFFTDANGCISKAAWREVPFRDVAYAEDQQLAIDMLRAGYAKAYVPEAAVVHSHEHPPLELLCRSFDEWRALKEVYGIVEPAGPRGFRDRVAVAVKADVRDLRATGAPLARGILGSVSHHSARWAGALLGSRSARLPARARRALSLERRA